MENNIHTQIAYFDESGDDGLIKRSSDIFVLTSFYMPTTSWQHNYNVIKKERKLLKEKYGFHISQEMHTKNLVTNKHPYRQQYEWDNETRLHIIGAYASIITQLDAKSISVIIDKTKIKRNDYKILNTALKYNIQRIENASGGDWNYILVTDKGRLTPMRKTAREIRAYNPIHSMFNKEYTNKPIRYMVEDIFEKDSKESHFIQVCDFISFFVFHYYNSEVLNMKLPKRIRNTIDENHIKKLLDFFKTRGVFNLSAGKENEYGFVIYPK